MTVRNSSTDSSSGSSSDSSSSGSSSSSSGSGSSSSDSDSSTSENPTNTATTAPKSPKSPAKQTTSEDSNSSNKKKDEKSRSTSRSASRSASITKVSSSSEDEPPKPVASKTVTSRRRSSAKSKANASVAAKQTKPATKTNDKQKITSKTTGKTTSQSSSKKKSIFSPDNSSESEDEKSKSKTVSKVTPPSTRGKGRPRKASNKDVDKTPVKKDEPKESKRRSVSSSSGPPSKKTSDNKASTTSCSSSQSSANSDSDSVCETDASKKPPEIKTGKTKPPSSINKQNPKAETSKCIVETSKPVTRKLTRSLSARVSRLIKARAATDTDSETDDKSSDKRKRGQKSPAVPAILPIPSPPEPRERQCPVRGCDSQGHLGGKSDRHFTWDACPLYHNVSATWCVAMSEERQGALAARRRALQAMQQRPRHQPTIDQRAYQLKVKDMRSKWRGSQELKEKLIAAGNPHDEMTEEREPILEGFVPDYDLRLFREAQAQAAIKIEEELGDIPTHKGTRFVVMGKYMMEVWYQSPYPGDAARVPRLFVCEFCLNHHKSAQGHDRHRAKCVWRHPPGDEVYRNDNLSVWQVDGRKHKHYCQQLCLLAKFFLDHKTLYYDVEPFLFYVMTTADKEGCHVVGYFSKEKNSFLNYNVSCILTLPPYQRQGYGRLLIDFSYLLTKVEGKVGSPETPLSDLGLISYRSYWKEALLRRLCSAPGPTLSIRDLSRDLAIASCDIVSTLQERGLMKYWKGKHIVLKKQDVLEEVARRAERARCVEASCLRWTPPAPPPR